MKYLVLLGLLLGCEFSIFQFYPKVGECVQEKNRHASWEKDEADVVKILRIEGEYWQVLYLTHPILKGHTITYSTYPPFKDSWEKVDCKTFKKVD